MDKPLRIAKIANLTIAVSDVTSIEDEHFLTFVEGEEGLKPLILDLDTGDTRVDELEEHEMLGSAAHALVNPEKRRILVEYVKSGTKAELMARTIELLLAKIYGEDLRVDFSPVVKEDFVKEINSFTRIRMASLTLIKPNAGWDDHYTKISQLLQESGGEKADLSVRAARGETLSKDSGIVEVIKDVANDAQPYLSDAEIIGIKEGEETETVVPLNKHVLHRNINVPRNQDGAINVLWLRNKMKEIMGILL